MITAWRFAHLALAYPLQFRSGIINGGLGIEERFRRHRTLWQTHLEETKREILALPADDQLTILGAGRLLDIPLEELKTKFKRILLVDFDPGSLKYLKRNVDSQTSLRFEDVTGNLATFDRFISGSNPTTIQSYLKSAAEFSFPDRAPQYEGTVASINLMSQLPLSYLSLFERGFRNHFGKRQATKALPELTDALTPIAHRLFQEHLGQVGSEGLLITDFASNEGSTLFAFSNIPPPTTTWTWSITPEQKLSVASFTRASSPTQ